MKKKIIKSGVIVYILLCIVIVLIPNVAEYNTVTWKLFIAQFLVIPFTLMLMVLIYVIHIITQLIKTDKEQKQDR